MAQDPTSGDRGEDPRDPGFSDAPTYTDSGPLRAAGPGPHDPDNPVEQPDPEAVTYVGGEDGSASFGGAADTSDGSAPPTGNADRQTYPGGLKRLADRYQLEEPIASGGAAIVWRAFDDVLSRSVALKLLHPHLASDPDTVERFRREAVAAARLTHPNAVAIYDTGQERDVVYLVMEYVDGPSLRDVLQHSGPMDPGVVAALGEQVASALGEAHAQGLVHRDIKPANILLTSDGVAKVTDFGIAKALSGQESTLTTPGTVVGTAAYVAPEQLEGQDVDARADVYALGVVLYECLTGQPAFQGDTPTATAAARLHRDLRPPRQVRADVPRSLDDIIVRSTRRDRTNRYPDGSSLAAALAPLVRARPSDVTAVLVSDPDGEGPPSTDTGPVGIVEPPRDQGKRLLIAFVGGLLLALVAFFATDALGDGGAVTEPSPVDGEPLPIEDANDYDPRGDGENSAQVGRAYDGDAATAWRTQRYEGSARFGGLKDGVGIWFDLGAVHEVDSVVIDLETGGAEASLYVAEALPDPVDGILGWGDPVRSVELADPFNIVDLSADGGASGRYWLLWFTALPEIGETTYGAALTEIRFIAP